MKADAQSNPLECIGGDEKVTTPEGDGGFGEKDGLKALQSTGKPRSLQVCAGRCGPIRRAQVGLTTEGFHHGGEVGVGFRFARGFGWFGDNCQLFLRRHAVATKVIQQVSQIPHGRFLARAQGEIPVSADRAHGFAVW